MKIQITISLEKRLDDDHKEAFHKRVLVRGHFRVIRGKKVYVMAHYRKK